MKKLFLNILPAALLLLTFSFNQAIASAASKSSSSCSTNNASKQQVLSGIGATGSNGCSDSGVPKLISTVVNILSLVVGVAAIIAIIASGFKYITSGGSAEKIANAKGTLIWAIVGIIVAVLAKVLVDLVVHSTQSAVKGS